MAAGNRIGLTILYDPAKSLNKTRTPSVDLVLVHGLNGGYTNTWTCTTGGSDVVWPKDLLPKVQPRTRVLSFGYSGDIYENPSTSGIRDIARSLLSSLKLRRHSDGNGPIVFLAHCLGGLIVKQALSFANNEDEYYSIAKATHSVLFFGTPHFGADERKWLSIASAFSPLAKETDKATGNSKPSILVEMITRGARDLAEISEDFCQRSSHYKIKTFYEELPLKGAKKVIVDRMDTHMFIDNEISKGVHADHLGIVQFEDENDETFLHVCQYISEAVEEEVSAPPPPHTPPLPHPLLLVSLEEWAAREMARAMGALDNGRAAHISPLPARRPTITAGQHSPTTPLLLLDSPTQKPMPWETGKREEKVAIPVSRRLDIWEPEEEDNEEEIVHAPVSSPLRQPLLWNQKNDEKATAPVLIPTRVRQRIHWGVEKQEGTGFPWATDACVSDEEVEDDLSEGELGPSLVHDRPSQHKEADIHLDDRKISVTVTAVAVDEPRRCDKEIPARHPQSRTSTDNKIPTATTRAVGDPELEADKGAPAGEHGRISGFFSKMCYFLGRA
ncbi:hypothetical protein F5Y19DRAFT_390190 [Xylariaceae sp. FL1651]|nr:hypothetical protein F5Y19DRAFT_390190 [Xylariaceae sp. FL1651]